jgi:hypothetical protein
MYPMINEKLLIPSNIPNIVLTFSFEEIYPIYAFCATQILPAATPQRQDVNTIVEMAINWLLVKYMISADEFKMV